MPQTGSKDKSSSKRHFTVVIGTKEHGLYCSSSPSSAARKVVSKLCGKEKSKKVEFCLREITQGSKKKTYGPYLGHVEKLAKPIQLKGRLIERKPVALLKPKSTKKGGVIKYSNKKGGDNAINDDFHIDIGNCGKSRFSFFSNGNDCIQITNGDMSTNKVVLYYNKKTKKLEVRYFTKKNSDKYDKNSETIDFDSIRGYLRISMSYNTFFRNINNFIDNQGDDESVLYIAVKESISKFLKNKDNLDESFRRENEENRLTQDPELTNQEREILIQQYINAIRSSHFQGSHKDNTNDPIFLRLTEKNKNEAYKRIKG